MFGAAVASAVVSKYIHKFQDPGLLSLYNRPAPLAGFALGYFAARRTANIGTLPAVLAGVAGMLALADMGAAPKSELQFARLWSGGRDLLHYGFDSIPEITRDPPSLFVNP